MQVPRDTSRSIVRLLLPLIAVVICTAQMAVAQDTREDLQKMLREDASFGDQELSALANGEVVVKVLKGSEKKEVGVCGVVRITDPRDLSMGRLIESLRPNNNSSVLSTGRFSSPPAIDDLRSLDLEKRDMDDIRKCRIGACKLNLPASMIESLQNEINWNAPNVKEQATRLFRQMLVDYVRDYSQRGNIALVQYDNRKEQVNLTDEHHILLDKALFLTDIAPEFVRYLEQYPRTELPGVRDSLDWAKVTFGLDPIITVTNTADYTRTGGQPLFLIVTKQIFATRYADSALAVSALVTVSGDSATEQYLIFTSRTRSDQLRGVFGGLARSLAGTEAVSRVKEMLQRAKTRLEADPTLPTSSEPQAKDPTVVRDLLEISQIWWAALLAAAAILAGIYLVYRRYGR